MPIRPMSIAATPIQRRRSGSNVAIWLIIFCHDCGIAASITRARSVLDYAPRYSSLSAMRESLRWMVDRGQADVGGQRF